MTTPQTTNPDILITQYRAKGYITHTADQLHQLADQAYSTLPKKNRGARRVRIPETVIFAALREGYGPFSSLEISLALGLHIRTVQKYLAEWRRSPEYAEYWMHKIHQLLAKSEELSDSERLSAYVAMYGKAKAEAGVEEGGSVQIIVRHCLQAPEPKP